ncbi:MAG: hypothetical protein ACJ72S_09520 [Nitrososphaeraceae archaeon]
MSSINKRLSLRVPANVIYRGLKDTRLERLFPEFFTGVTRKLTTSNKANSELQFTTTTYDSQIQIKEIISTTSSILTKCLLLKFTADAESFLSEDKNLI